jgi:hypothetical protein
LALVSAGFESGMVTVALNLRQSDCKPTKPSHGGSVRLCGEATRVFLFIRSVAVSIRSAEVFVFFQSYNRLLPQAQAISFACAGLLCPTGWKKTSGLKRSTDINDSSLAGFAFRDGAAGGPAFLVSR